MLRSGKPTVRPTRFCLLRLKHKNVFGLAQALRYTFRQTAHYYGSSNDYDVSSASPWAWALDSGRNSSAGASIDDVRAAMRFVYDGWSPGSAPFNKTANPANATVAGGGGGGGAFFPCTVLGRHPGKDHSQQKGVHSKIVVFFSGNPC